MKIDNFFTAFGVITCEFAEMEGDLRTLLAGLAFGDNSVAAATFLDRSQLAENITILRKLARQHFEHEAEMADIAERIGKLRETRNLFIHGLWRPGNFVTANGVATVTDLRTAYEDKGELRKWVRGTPRDYTLAAFNALLRDIRAVCDLIEKLCEKLEREEWMSFAHHGVMTSGKPVRIAIGENGSVQVSPPTTP